MKKIVKLLALLLISVSLFISCNDGSEGLIQEAMNAEFTEKIKLMHPLGISEDTSKLYVATDKGIYTISSNGYFSSTPVYGTGNSAKYSTLYYDGKEAVVLNGNSFETINLSDNTSAKIADLEGFGYAGMYSPDGRKFTYVLTKDGSYYKLIGKPAEGNKPVLLADKASGYKASIIGHDAFRLENSSKEKDFKYNIAGVESKLTNVRIIGAQNGVGIAQNGGYYKGDNEKINNVETGAMASSFAAISSNGERYIYPYSHVYIDTTKTEKQASSSIKGLSSISVYSIIKNKNNDDHLIISQQHGLFLLRGTTITLVKDISGGINFNDYIY